MTKLLRTPDDIVAALRERRDVLGLTHEGLDMLSGPPSGYTSKVLCDPPMKRLGPTSLPALLGALGLALVAVEDSSAVERVSARWVRRKRAQRLPPDTATRLDEDEKGLHRDDTPSGEPQPAPETAE